MGKNNIENSLKRFLKRKVKITLGLIVTFLITGALGFAEVNMPENKNENWLEGIGAEKELPSKDFALNDTHTIKIENNTIKIVSNNETQEIKLKNLSNQTFENIKISVQNIEKANSWKENLKNIEEYNKWLDKENINNVGNEANKEGAIAVNRDNKLKNNINYENTKVAQLGTNGGIIINYADMNNTEGHFQYAVKNSKVYNYGVLETTGNETQMILDNSIGYNFGEITCKWTGQKAENNSTVYNYGKITSTNGGLGQFAVNNSSAYNNGVISVPVQGQYAQGKDAKVYNYGIIIANNGQGHYIENGGEGYNYGIIVAGTKYGGVFLKDFSKSENYGLILGKGQELYGNSQAKNYGIIMGKSAGQYLEKNNNKAWNYGTIKNYSDKGQAIGYESESHAEDWSSFAYNYGVIANQGDYGQFIGDVDNSEIYNYGIVANTGKVNIKVSTTYNTQSQGYNYGVLVNSSGNATEGNVINNGIIIATENGRGEMAEGGTNNGVIYNKNDNKITVGTNTFELAKSDKVSNIKENNIFVNNLDKDNNVTLTVDTDTLKDKHITTVVGKDSSANNVIKKNGNLNLKDTSIVGYFEKNGTLLNVNGNLTLEGNSVINAIAGNEYTGYIGENLDDIVAVKLSKNGKLEIKDNSMVLGAVEGNGTIVYENIDNEAYFNKQEIDSILINTTAGETTEIALGNITLKDSGIGVQDAGKLVIDNQSSKELSEDKKFSTSITLANNINIEKGIDGSNSANGIELILGDGQKSSDNLIKVDGEILLGQADDTIIINNILGKYDENQKTAVIDGGEKDDTVILKNLNGNHDTFDYALKNVETLDLNKQTWKIGENAGIEFGNNGTTTKATDKITVQNGTLMGELKGDKDTGASFENGTAVDSVLGNSTFGDNAKFQMGIGKDMILEAGAEYNIEDNLKNNLATNVGKDKITASGIFTHAKDDTSKELRVRTAQEMGINSRYAELYNKMLANADREDVRNVLNNGSFEEIADIINSKGAMGDTLATTGYKITRDISNSFISSVNEWNKKANKGEWLANAKYINSDMEYDGANSVKGYDSDITSMVGMIEYGVSDNTSYGVALGGGDTEVDVTGAGTLKGDNYYIGAYAKHSTNGFDLVGNLGYTISDLEVDGEGSADSSAITLAGYVKRDIRLTETVKLEPNLAFTYDYIMQDDAEGNGVKVENKDIHVFEATAGMNIVKEFTFNNGNLELKAGVKYSMADINRNEETTISAFGMEPEVLGNPEVDDTKGTAHIGFDYEHETGFGINAKYETMWSDSGDDSRITAGVSYKF